jgi:hypothetical protein
LASFRCLHLKRILDPLDQTGALLAASFDHLAEPIGVDLFRQTRQRARQLTLGAVNLFKFGGK